MFCSFHNVRIAAVQAVVPEQKINLEDEIEYYGGNRKKIQRIRSMAGMETRRVCPDGVTASDLCAAAANRLLQNIPFSHDLIDALIFVSQTPDYDLPATACILQYQLGLPQSCAAFDVAQGCAGYVYGLWLAASLLSSGAARQVLLLVGEARPQRYDPRNRIVAPVFGDSGSATLLVRDADAPPMYFCLGTDGSGYDAIIIPAGRARIPYVRTFEENRDIFSDIPDRSGVPWRLNELYMNGGAIFNFSTTIVPQLIENTLAHSGTPKESVDYLVLHQANKQIMETIADKAGFPLEKTPTTSFSKYGNLLGASIPAALCDVFGNGAKPGCLLLCGYGVGLSWGTCLTKVDSWQCRPVQDFSPPENHPSRQTLIGQWQKRFSE